MHEDKTPERIKQSILVQISQAGANLETREGSFLDTMIGPTALEIWKLYDSQNALVPIVYIDETSGHYIDMACARYGITRKEGTYATAVMHLEGDAGTVIPAGTVFQSSGGIEFELEREVTLADGSTQGAARAAARGSRYNIGKNTLTQMVQTISGLHSWSNEQAKGGTDQESDAALVARYYARLRNPSTSGNVHDYEQWAMEVSGVGAVRVLPLWAGPGTVKVLVASADMQPANQTVVQAVFENIERNRPIKAEATVESAGSLELSIRYRAVLDGSATANQVQADFTSSAIDYVRSLVFKETQVIYNRLAMLLLSVPGVTDFTLLTVNGGSTNIPIGSEQIPVVKEVVAE